MVGQLRWSALVAGMAITVTACGAGETSRSDGAGVTSTSDGVGETSTSGDESLPSRLQKILPSGSPSPTVTPVETPSGAQVVTGKHFSIAVPSDFEEQTVPQGGQNPPMHLFRAPTDSATQPVRVAVVTETNAKTSAIEQSYTLEVAKQGQGVKDFRRSSVTWPGTQRAILLQWTQAADGGKEARTQTWQLMAQVDEDVILSVVAIAPVSEFDAAELAQVFQTFRPQA